MARIESRYATPGSRMRKRTIDGTASTSPSMISRAGAARSSARGPDGPPECATGCDCCGEAGCSGPGGGPPVPVVWPCRFDMHPPRVGGQKRLVGIPHRIAAPCKSSYRRDAFAAARSSRKRSAGMSVRGPPTRPESAPASRSPSRSPRLRREVVPAPEEVADRRELLRRHRRDVPRLRCTRAPGRAAADARGRRPRAPRARRRCPPRGRRAAGCERVTRMLTIAGT